MEDAIWNVPMHVGWQIIHAFNEAQGQRRKFAKDWENEDDSTQFEDFRSIQIPEDEEDNSLSI